MLNKSHYRWLIYNLWQALVKARLQKEKDFFEVEFVTEQADWAIKRVGDGICFGLNKIYKNNFRTIISPVKSNSSVLHFGSQYMWLQWYDLLPREKKIVVSFFHGKKDDGPDVATHIDDFMRSLPKISKVVTASSILEKRLIDWGVPPDKLVKIPIGVDSKLFYFPEKSEKAIARKRFGIKPNSVVVGSFQKDGVGWGKGLVPKLIKGPDIFVEALAHLKNSGVPVLAFLTGPARGYVKKQLESLEIPFIHKYVETHADLVSCYHALDLYLVSSREEGGPMGLIESMASGVPVVSTPVGMGPDLIKNKVNGHVTGQFTGDALASAAKSILSLKSSELDNLRRSARDAAETVDWSVVGRLHWEKIYRGLIDDR